MVVQLQQPCRVRYRRRAGPRAGCRDEDRGGPRPVPGPRRLRGRGPRRSSRCRRRVSSPSSDPSRPRSRACRGRAGREVLPHPALPCPMRASDWTAMPAYPRARTGRDGRALARGQPGGRGEADWQPHGRPVHRGRHLRLERRAQRRVHGRRARRRSARSRSASRWPGWRGGPTRTRRC